MSGNKLFEWQSEAMWKSEDIGFIESNLNYNEMFTNIVIITKEMFIKPSGVESGIFQENHLSMISMTWCPSHQQCFDPIRNSTKIWHALVLYHSQRNLAHVTTEKLLWHVQNFFVIGWGYFKLEHSKFLLHFESNWNTIGGMGAWFFALLGHWQPQY